jgi:hypothetical protein
MAELITRPNPQPDLVRFTKENQGWEFKDEVEKLYRRAEVMMERFYPVFDLTRFDGQLPRVVLAVESLRNKNTLAAYRLVKDEYGFDRKITFNEQHYVRDKDGKPRWEYGEWAQNETLCHELGHNWQQLIGKNPFKPTSRVTHNKEFTDKMKSLGIHCESEGYHNRLADLDSPFGLLMKEWGVEPPEETPAGTISIDWFKFTAGDRKGRSTLIKWQCPECKTSVRYTRKDDPMLLHLPCGTVFVRADAVNQTIYKAEGGVDDENKN